MAENTSQCQVSNITLDWDLQSGTCTFEKLPVAMMWVDTTLAGLMAGLQAMVGTKRFGLALQSEGRKSVELDWQVIAQSADFSAGFEALANIAAVAGWGKWRLLSLDAEKKEGVFQIQGSWEGKYQKALGVCWGSGMLAGKLAGYCSKLFATNCWADQLTFTAQGDEFDTFRVQPSDKTFEHELDNLLVTDEATKVEMAVALQKLQKEIQARSEAEKRFRHTFEQAAVGVAHVSPDGRFLNINQKFCDIVGYSRQELLELSFQDITCPDDLDTDLAYVQQILSGEIDTYSMEKRYFKKDGSILWVNLTVSLVLSASGTPEYFISVIEDITQRKQIEKIIQEKEQFQAALLNDMITFVAVLKPDGEVIFVNNTPLEVGGLQLEDVVGKKFYDAGWWTHSAEVRDMVINDITRCNAGETLVHDVQIRIADGSLMWIEYSMHPIFDEKGNVQYLIPEGRDISDRRKAQQEKIQIESQLHQSHKLESIGTLATGVAHEINQPLTYIRTMFEAAAHEIEIGKFDKEEFQADCSEALKQVSRISRIIDHLRTFARDDYIEISPINLKEVLDNALILLRQRLRLSNITLMRTGDQPPDVLANSIRLEQVFINLLQNSIDALEGKENKVIEVKMESNEVDKTVCIQCIDNGDPIPEKFREKIFEPFFTTRETGKGTGLGLSIVYGIIKEFGGSITYTGQESRSCFTIILPVID